MNFNKEYIYIKKDAEDSYLSLVGHDDTVHSIYDNHVSQTESNWPLGI